MAQVRIPGPGGKTALASAPSFVQVTPVANCASVATCTVTFSGATVAGNLIAIFYDFESARTLTNTTHGSDTGATCGVVTNNTTLGAKSGIDLLKNLAGTGTTVVVTVDSAANFIDAVAVEYSGASTTAPCDGTGSSANQSTTGTSLTPGSATATKATAMLFDGCTTENAGGPWTTTGGWTSRSNVGSGGLISEDKAVTSASAQNPAITSTNTGHNWTCQQVAIDSP